MVQNVKVDCSRVKEKGTDKCCAERERERVGERELASPSDIIGYMFIVWGSLSLELRVGDNEPGCFLASIDLLDSSHEIREGKASKRKVNTLVTSHHVYSAWRNTVI